MPGLPRFHELRGDKPVGPVFPSHRKSRSQGIRSFAQVAGGRRQAVGTDGPPQLKKEGTSKPRFAVHEAQESQGGCLPTGPQQAPSSSLGTHIQHGGDERCARGLVKR